MDGMMVSEAELRSFACGVLEAVGTPPDLAGQVAGSLLEADLAGCGAHGIIRLPGYVRSVRDGRVRPERRARVVSRRGVTATVSAEGGWGQPAARLAAETAAGIAHDGAAAVVVRDCPHIGRLADYATMIAAHGQVAFIAVNAPALVAPFGGTGRRLGTNPLAFGIPRGRGKPAIVPDFATAAATEWAVEMARAAGRDVAPGTITTASGAPTTRPDDFCQGGALLPAHGHKGYGLAVAVEVLGGVLSGTGPASLEGFGGGNGVFMLALDVASFCDPGAFFDQIAGLATVLHDAPATEGGERRVMLPGEPEILTTARRRRAGIPVPGVVWHDVCRLAGELGVSLPQSMV